jgi:biopolymer transport protein ExbD
MAFQNHSNQEMMSEINVTPLVDVMLVLLVVFIVTAPLLTQAVGVKLPKVVATSVTTPARQKMVSIDAQGVVRLDETVVTDAVLTQQLTSLVGIRADFELQVDADAAVPYGKVAQVMAIAQHAGVGKLSFVSNVAH